MSPGTDLLALGDWGPGPVEGGLAPWGVRGRGPRLGRQVRRRSRGCGVGTDDGVEWTQRLDGAMSWEPLPAQVKDRGRYPGPLFLGVRGLTGGDGSRVRISDGTTETRVPGDKWEC